MVAPGHDGALLCWLSPAPCVLLCLLLLTLQLFFYTWRGPVSPASQFCFSCVIGFDTVLGHCCLLRVTLCRVQYVKSKHRNIQ